MGCGASSGQPNSPASEAAPAELDQGIGEPVAKAPDAPAPAAKAPDAPAPLQDYLLVLHSSQVRAAHLQVVSPCVLGGSNQWNLDELKGSLEQTPFWRAIALDCCNGVVQLMDKNCTPPTRIWCILEIHVMLELQAQGKRKDFEVLATIQEGTQQCMLASGPTDVPEQPVLALGDDFEVLAAFEPGTQQTIQPASGLADVPEQPVLLDAQGEEHIYDVQFGHFRANFPLEVAVKGARVKVQEAEASQAQDRKSILNAQY